MFSVSLSIIMISIITLSILHNLVCYGCNKCFKVVVKSIDSIFLFFFKYKNQVKLKQLYKFNANIHTFGDCRVIQFTECFIFISVNFYIWEGIFVLIATPLPMQSLYYFFARASLFNLMMMMS